MESMIVYIRSSTDVYETKSRLDSSRPFPLPMQTLTLRRPNPGTTEYDDGAQDHPGAKPIPEDPNAREQADEFA